MFMFSCHQSLKIQDWTNPIGRIKRRKRIKIKIDQESRARKERRKVKIKRDIKIRRRKGYVYLMGEGMH